MSNSTSEWKSDWHVQSSEAIAKVKSGKSVRVVTYDSPRSIANKVRHAIKDQGYGGLMVWSIDTDDFNGDCDPTLNADTFSDFRTKPQVRLNIPKRTVKTYPLLRTLNEAIVLAIDEMQQEQNSETDTDMNEIDSNDNTTKKPNKPSSASTKFVSIVMFCFSVVISKML